MERNLRSTFGQEYKRYTPEYRDGYNVTTSQQGYDRYQQITGLPSWVEGQELQTTSLEDILSGGQKVLVNKEFKLGIIISKSQMEDNQYKDMFRMTTLLARGGRETVELIAAAEYNNGFTSATSGDGQAIFSASHPLYKSGGTQSNLNTAAALSYTSLWAAITAASQAVDAAGLRVNLTLGRIVLIVPPALEKVASDLFFNQNIAGTANRDTNTLKQTGRNWTYNVNHFLTSTTAWFLYFPDVMDGMIFQWRINPQFNQDEQFSQGTRYEGRERFSVGCGDYLAVAGNAGA
jgi:phage major head subunit gpT-like protein